MSDVNVETAIRENALYASKGSITQLINFTRRNPTEVYYFYNYGWGSSAGKGEVEKWTIRKNL